MAGSTYRATWGKALRYVSWFCVALGFIIPGTVYFAAHQGHRDWLLVGGLYWGIVLIAALFTVRGYRIEPNVLAIERLLWTTRLPLTGLQSAEFLPEAMRGSIRLWGNGGMFSITGWYRNRKLGSYRAFATNLQQTVVLQFAGRTVVVTPENPEPFVTEISRFAFRTA
ncbi:MAG TPA: PH domain-containing protein [Dongiaceae bacterium]|jgi:hypothetical protein|nr:PH domain-containing protein [Dongiaceae bacterium]